MLTQDELAELENLINNFEIKIDIADNKIETEAIYEDIVVSLNDYGILPKDMSIEKAQRIVTGKEHNQVLLKHSEKYLGKNQKRMDNNGNTHCLIAGFTSNTYFIGPIGRILWYLSDFITWEYILGIIVYFLLIAPYVWGIIPLQFGYAIGIGAFRDLGFNPEYFPANGRVYTIGSNGVISWNGSFYGHIPHFRFFHGYKECYPGVLGFTGVKIGLLSSHFYMGFAQHVKIDKERP
jgi:hypothetical protein